jgi:origin recognition complex subunit 2
LSATKKTPVSKAMERVTPSKSVGKRRSAPSTPSSATKGDTPLRRLKLTGDAPPTPRVVRRKVAKDIEKEVAEDSDESADSSEEEEESDSDDDDGVKPLNEEGDATPSKRRKESDVKSKVATRHSKKSATGSLNTDDYFETCGDKKVLTSDQTLSQLKTPRLSPEVLKSILDGEELKYEPEIQQLVCDHKTMFSKWMHLLSEGFNVVLFGLGSKRSLLNDFHSEMLNDKDCVVINGFFPSLTMKQVLNVILNDILAHKGNVGGTVSEQVEIVCQSYSKNNVEDLVADDLYLVVHNIDGPMLRSEVTQSLFSKLAGHPRIHMICSIDHINAPLLWDQHKLAKFNFTWYDATTFLPYTEETLNENSLMVRSGGGTLALHSLLRVFESLTPNAKEIYLIIVKYQLTSVEKEGFSFYRGLTFKDLYR